MMCGTVLLPFGIRAQSNAVTVKGTVVEKGTNAPIEFATVAIINTETHSPLAGANTGSDGSFSIRTTAQHFQIEISFIGYQTQVITDVTPSNGVVDLGKVTLKTDAKQLEEVVVQAEKSTTEYRLDKRVFNVGEDLSTGGASAMDVLNNVPSVNVNIEGTISLRGSSGVQVLINGKPSVMSDDGNALATITADMIESVEVITNPSAKYDAEGTSGIINIILKKDERKGTNGSFSVNTGIPDNHSAGISLNHRSDKFNLFTQMGVGYKSSPDKTVNRNRDLETDSTVYSKGTEYRNERYYNITLGSDYHINEHNTVTLSGNYNMELEKQPSTLHYALLTGANQEKAETWRRKESTDATNPRYQFDAQYKRAFNGDEDHSLLVSATGNFFGKDLSSLFNTTTLTGDSDHDAHQRTATDFGESKYTFKADYAQPVTKAVSIEAGGQYLTNDVYNDYTVENLEDNVWTVDDTQTNRFEYLQNVLGVYGTGAYEQNKWGVKLGLRMEHTDLNTELTTTGEKNSQNYSNFFPSGHASYKLQKNLSLQAGYSKRIYRPRLWDLNPFFNIRNTYSIRRGNPDLHPEFTDSYEIGTLYDASAASINLSVYHRYTTAVIERISSIQDNVTVTRPENIGTNRSTGIELNGKTDPFSWLTINTEFNYNYYVREGSLEGVVFDFNADQWSAKLNTKWELPADIDVEATGRYQSTVQTVQGHRNDYAFLDLGARKKVLNKKGVLNLSVRDVFASRIERNIVEQSGYEVYSRDMRGRFVTLGFSYSFGKGEAMEYGGKGFH